MNTILFLLMLLAIIWFWQDSLRSREFAIKYCKDKCKEMNLQLLDQTIALKSLSLKRNSMGSLVITRRYNLEYSINGVDRYKGSILIGKDSVDSFQLDHPDGLLILQNDHLIKPN